MDSERPFTFGPVVGFHRQVRCQGPFMFDHSKAKQLVRNLRMFSRFQKQGPREDAKILRLSLPLFEKSNPAWGSLSLLWKQRLLYSIQGTGVYFGLLFLISSFYFSTFTRIKRCIWSSLCLCVGVEVSGSIGDHRRRHDATSQYIFMGKLDKCIISSNLKWKQCLIFKLNSLQFSMSDLWHQ